MSYARFFQTNGAYYTISIRCRARERLVHARKNRVTSLPKLNAKVQRQTQVLCHARVLVRQVLLTYMPFDVRLRLFRNVLPDCSSRRSRRDCAQDPIVVAPAFCHALVFGGVAFARATIGLERGCQKPLRHRRPPSPVRRGRFRLSPRANEESMECQC